MFWSLMSLCYSVHCDQVVNYANLMMTSVTFLTKMLATLDSFSLLKKAEQFKTGTYLPETVKIPPQNTVFTSKLDFLVSEGMENLHKFLTWTFGACGVKSKVIRPLRRRRFCPEIPNNTRKHSKDINIPSTRLLLNADSALEFSDHRCFHQPLRIPTGLVHLMELQSVSAEPDLACGHHFGPAPGHRMRPAESWDEAVTLPIDQSLSLIQSQRWDQHQAHSSRTVIKELNESCLC